MGYWYNVLKLSYINIFTLILHLIIYKAIINFLQIIIVCHCDAALCFKKNSDIGFGVQVFCREKV